jgi:hypothetical protein
VYNVTNHIYGHGANVAAGSHIRQKSSIEVGDLHGLQQAAEEAGLTAEDAAEFAQAVQADGDVSGPRTTRFLQKLRSGALNFAGGLTSDVVAGSLIEAGKMYLGIS